MVEKHMSKWQIPFVSSADIAALKKQSYWCHIRWINHQWHIIRLHHIRRVIRLASIDSTKSSSSSTTFVYTTPFTFSKFCTFATNFSIPWQTVAAVRPRLGFIHRYHHQPLPSSIKIIIQKISQKLNFWMKTKDRFSHLAICQRFDSNKTRRIGPIDKLLAKWNRFHVLTQLTKHRPRRPLWVLITQSSCILSWKQKLLAADKCNSPLLHLHGAEIKTTRCTKNALLSRWFWAFLPNFQALFLK